MEYVDNGTVPAAGDGVSGVFEQILGTINYGLNRAIDREFGAPWTVNDPAGWQYAIGPQGGYYVRGQPGQLPGVSQPQPNPLPGMVVAVGLAALLFFALK